MLNRVVRRCSEEKSIVTTGTPRSFIINCELAEGVLPFGVDIEARIAHLVGVNIRYCAALEYRTLICNR